MEVSIAAGDARVPFDAPVLGMEVELDTPANIRHGEIDAGQPAARAANQPSLAFDRYASTVQLLGEQDLAV